MNSLTEVIAEYLRSGSYLYTFPEKSLADLTFYIHFNETKQTVAMHEFISIGSRDFRVIGVMPFSVPQNARAAASEYLMRVNWALQTGWFSMDYDDGEVRMTAQRFLLNGDLSQEDFNAVVRVPFTHISRFATGLILTIQGAGTPRENADRFIPAELKG